MCNSMNYKGYLQMDKILHDADLLEPFLYASVMRWIILLLFLIVFYVANSFKHEFHLHE